MSSKCCAGPVTLPMVRWVSSLAETHISTSQAPPSKSPKAAARQAGNGRQGLASSAAFCEELLKCCSRWPWWNSACVALATCPETWSRNHAGLAVLFRRLRSETQDGPAHPGHPLQKRARADASTTPPSPAASPPG